MTMKAGAEEPGIPWRIFILTRLQSHPEMLVADFVFDTRIVLCILCISATHDISSLPFDPRKGEFVGSPENPAVSALAPTPQSHVRSQVAGGLGAGPSNRLAHRPLPVCDQRGKVEA